MAVLARELHGGNDISNVRATSNGGWTFVDHAVVELTRLSVARIVLLDQAATAMSEMAIISLGCVALAAGLLGRVSASADRAFVRRSVNVDSVIQDAEQSADRARPILSPPA